MKILSVATFIVSFLLSISFYSKGSNEVSSLPQVSYSNLTRELNFVTNRVKEEIDQNSSTYLYLRRDNFISSLRNQLFKKFGNDSLLACFPDLDKDTFSKVIQSLREASLDRSDVILYVWSLMTGIKVVGLKQGAEYYSTNCHLKKYVPANMANNDIKVVYSLPKIRVEVGSNDTFLVDVPLELSLSSFIFRSNFGTNKLRDVRENQLTIWTFLSDELRALNKDEALVKDFLSSVLSEDANRPGQPLYSLGITKLLQNTAVYLSAHSGLSKVIEGPCSHETTNYTGLQDGLFLTATSDSYQKRTIDRLFGYQIYRRSLFKSVAERHSIHKKSKLFSSEVEYTPHYCLKSLGQGQLRDVLSPYDGSDSSLGSFEQLFSEYADGDLRGNSTVIICKIKELLDVLDDQQLKRPLTTFAALREEFQPLLFESAQEVDLSGKGSLDCPLRMDALVKHLSCASYQDILKIKLKKNGLDNEDIEVLSEALSLNILPYLEEIDLRDNPFTNVGLLMHLLKRYRFKRLITSLRPEEFGMPIDASLIPKILANS